MSNILGTITDLLKKSIQGDPPPPGIIQNLGDRLTDLMAVSADASGDGIDRWLTKFRALTGDVVLRETLLVRALQMNFPRVAETLTLLDIITFAWGADPALPLSFGINWKGLNKFFTEPGDQFLLLLLGKIQSLDDLKAVQVLFLLLISSAQELIKLEYKKQGFSSLPVGPAGINSTELLDLIEKLVKSPTTLPLPFNPPLTLDVLKAKANIPSPDYIKIEGPANPNDLTGLALEIGLQNVEKVIDDLFDLGGGWKLGFTTTGNGVLKYRIQFKNDGPDTGIGQTNNLTLILSRQKDADDKALLIGQNDGTHFSIKNISAGLQFNNTGPLFAYNLIFNRIEFSLKPDFLKFLSVGLNLPTLLSFTSDVALTYVQGKGLSGQGASGGTPALGIEFATPINLKIGGTGAGISIDQVLTRMEVATGNNGLLFRIFFRYGANGNFGPLKMILDGAGLWIGRWTNGNGGLLPPQGIGISLDAGPVKGGGFLKIISDHEFAGALQIKILQIGAFAYCIYKTLPTGDISFVAIIGIRLPPPGIQISFGFAVSGFGGLVGINRRADTDQLRERLASGTAGDVLFNDDPMKNAPRLLGDMQLLFPDEKGIFLIGPTLQINWLYILKLDAGFFIELPGPRKFFIAGTAKLVIGSEEFALVYLRMDFVGGVDTTRSLIFFDAVLVNSHVLGIFRISGGVSLRIAYGENGYFLFSVGGFHPSFNPGSMELPRVPRVGVAYSIGPVWLKEEMYLAITSNTFQLGWKTEAGIEIGPISAHGWFGFDALVQFRPFHFVGRIDAGFDVEVKGVSLCNVHVEGLLSGPGPLVLQAKASVKLLFVRVSGDVTIHLNDNPPEQPIHIPDIPAYLKDKGELSKPENMRSEGSDPSVVYGPFAEGEKIFPPLGEIIWEQKRVPLNLPIEKLEGVDLGGWHTIEPSATFKFTSETDWFGVGTYLKLSDGEALNNPRFSRQQSGLRIGTQEIVEGIAADAELKLNLIKIEKPSRFRFEGLLGALYENAALSSLLAERSGNAKLVPGKAAVKVNDEVWNAHSGNGKVQNTGPLNGMQAFVNAKRSGGIALPATEKKLNLTGVI